MPLCVNIEELWHGFGTLSWAADLAHDTTTFIVFNRPLLRECEYCWIGLTSEEFLR